MIKLAAHLRSLRADRRGNVAVTFAIALLPILGLVGAAVDYSIAVNTRTKIEAALDTAVLLATSKTEANLPTATAQADALKMFAAQVAMFGVTTKSSSITITDGVNGRVATGTAAADVPTTFMKVMGFNSIAVNGNATAKVGLPVYVDFYLLLDNSPSMGVAATPADITTMVNNTTDQCAFACHDTYTSSSRKTLNKNSYYDLAKKLGVTMRIDVVRQATQALMDKAAATEAVSDQFRMAIYTMGADCSGVGQTTITPLTSSLSSAKSAAAGIDLMTIPYAGYNNDQCTDFDNVLASMNNTIPTSGAGTSTDPQKYLFFVSDGVADAYYPTSCTKKTTSGRCQEPLTTAICDTLKNRGVKIAVLYTTYLALPTNSWYMNWIDPFNKGPYGPSPNSEIAQKMQACASPGFYFEVSPTDGISEAMNALFQKAVSTAHLTN
ncbi:TadE/TadG family type IV pilus assembly protein [Bradyrhizobium sp. WD16]|uniref:TadE/TadG family type IV pilus assembly protein n=1 Tax=Bradyrhizobium sp. WD16 TaxID=1521768 RepID=UPI0020A3375E|nr:TadE/TadG family type IV pilus assembly protein [Bradyrhizobium sp. WD16]UTD29233.1 pilus assembly protein TadG [Bradyrhizobium sp. WD16]